jgi:membrane-associated protein
MTRDGDAPPRGEPIEGREAPAKCHHCAMLGFSLAEKIVHWMEPAFATAGYAIVAAGVLAERSMFVGLIVPGDIILALGGVYASQGRLQLWLVVLIGVLAATAGESIGYWIGRRFGRPFLRRIPLVGRLEGRLDDAEGFFKRHGGTTVAVGRYATAAGAFVPFSAGVGRMPYRRFLLFDIPAIVVWAIGITLFGYLSGQHLSFIDTVLSRFGYAVLGLVVAFFLSRLLWRRIKGRRSPSARPGSG